MNNETMKLIIEELKKMQSADVDQFAKYKALMMKLDDTIRERALVIKLLESGNNPEHRNQTLATILNY